MLFDYLKSLTVTKDDSLTLNEYIPYLINRWLSFSDNNLVIALNETVNSLGNFEKEKHFKLLLTLLPKLKRQQKINYIKKKKNVKDKEETDRIKLLAQSLEMSEKEVIRNIKLVEYFKELE